MSNRMNRSELVANLALNARRSPYHVESFAKQAAYEAEARARLAKLKAAGARNTRPSLVSRALGVFLLVAVATYGLGFVMGVW